MSVTVHAAHIRGSPLSLAMVSAELWIQSCEFAAEKTATAGAFVSSCIIHVQSAFNENHVAWHNITVGGATPSDVVADWLAGRPAVVVEDVDFPGNPQCQSFT